MATEEETMAAISFAEVDDLLLVVDDDYNETMSANVLMSEDDDEDDAHHIFPQLSLHCTNNTEEENEKDDSFLRPVSINNKKDWRQQRYGSPDGDLDCCRLLVRPRGLGRSISMDMEEIKACRDLGLPLPREWTVEISCGTESGSGETSPISNWPILSPGDDPREIKARLKVWAQAVVLASSSSSSSLLGN